MSVTIHQTGSHTAVLERIMNASKENTAAARRDIPQLLWEGNRLDRLQGLDARGQPLPAVKKRSGRYAGAPGAPMVPFGEMSRAVASFFARVAGQFIGGFRISAGFQGPGVEILAYHAEGKAGTGRKGEVTRIVRDVFGFSDRTRESLVALLREHRDMTIQGKVMKGVRAWRRGWYETFGVFRSQGR